MRKLTALALALLMGCWPLQSALAAEMQSFQVEAGQAAGADPAEELLLAEENPVQEAQQPGENPEETQLPEEDPAQASVADGISARALMGAVWQVRIPDPGPVCEIQVPTWAENNGQDDLIWYDAHPNSDGSWSVEIDTARHGGGTMHSHVYVDGRLLGGVTYAAPVPEGAAILAMPGGGYLYTVLISNVRRAVPVQIAAWSGQGGQDDLAWYDAQYCGSGVWKAAINTARHGGGAMICRAYASGAFLGSVSYIAPEAPPVTVHTELLYGTRYDVVMENLWGADRVEVPTWGEANGQDDIYWYKAKNTAPGTWRAEINAASHDEGAILSHVYADGRGISSNIRVSRSYLSVQDGNRTTAAPNLGSYSRRKVAWGTGGPKGASGRPDDAVAAQKQYSAFGADFIGPATDRIYLTFDEGYENGYTPSILDTLKEKNVKAVFFVTYPFVQERPDLVRRMIDEGHEVGSHSMTHPSFPGISDAKAFNEVMLLHRVMEQKFGYDMKLFRFPSGEFCERDLALVQALGYRSVFWSFAYRDWEPSAQIGAAAALQKATKALHPGALYLLHAVSSDNNGMLGDFIDYCRAHGLEPSPYDLT